MGVGSEEGGEGVEGMGGQAQAGLAQRARSAGGELSFGAESSEARLISLLFPQLRDTLKYKAHSL